MGYRFLIVIIFLLVGIINRTYSQTSQLISLNINEVVIDTVYAAKRNNKTAIRLIRGETYKISATGQWQDAGFTPTDANGFEGFTKAMKKGAFLKPMKEQYYMMLLAKVGGQKIAIGTEKVITPKRNGRLIFIPNDATFFFGNNSGELVVTVERVE